MAFRRSDLIESIHDGSYFNDHFKLWVFLPAGIVLAALLVTGIHRAGRVSWTTDLQF
ncbi:MAG: hypothetical protein ACI8W8_003917 [Rhodothermales bacterium]